MIDFLDEFEELKKLHADSKYVECISYSVQFLELVSGNALKNIYHLDTSDNGLISDIIDGTNISKRDFISLHQKIQEKYTEQNSWKMKAFAILNLCLEGYLNSISLDTKLIGKIENLHAIRNKIQHDWYNSNKRPSKRSIRLASIQGIDICTEFMNLHSDGYLD